MPLTAQCAPPLDLLKGGRLERNSTVNALLASRVWLWKLPSMQRRRAAPSELHDVPGRAPVRGHARLRAKLRKGAALGKLAFSLIVLAALAAVWWLRPAWIGMGRQDDLRLGSFPDDHALTEVIDGRTYHPSFGVFPRGCRWRAVTSASGFSSDVEYVWWDAKSGTWVEDQPAACAPPGDPAPGQDSWNFHNNSPRSELTCDNDHCMYTNLYYNRGRWYVVVDGPDPVGHWRFSRNQEISTIPVDDAWSFVDSIKWNVITGDTILFDFIFFTHPTAIGHWWEMLGPLYSILKRKHVLEWVRAMIAVALGVPLGKELPPVYIQRAANGAWNQLTSPLEGLDPDTWYIFERVAITKDLYTGGGRQFLHTEDAREFRGLIYKQYGLPQPQPRKSIPHVITFQRKRANRRILNEPEFINMLKEFGDVRVVEFNETSSLYEQLLCMRDTGVYISVHTSNLANSPLLMPGSAVFEIIQRNWHWNGLDTSFQVQTMMMGDIHHYAWRAQGLNETFYLDERDMIKVGHWPPEECGTEECVEAHAKVDVKVDIPAFRKLLQERLPLVWGGRQPWERVTQIPWPPAQEKPGYDFLPSLSPAESH